MAMTWAEIMANITKLPPQEIFRLKREMLEEKGMTWGQFMTTEEYREVAKAASENRFVSTERSQMRKK